MAFVIAYDEHRTVTYVTSEIIRSQNHRIGRAQVIARAIVREVMDELRDWPAGADVVLTRSARIVRGQLVRGRQASDAGFVPVSHGPDVVVETQYTTWIWQGVWHG